MKSEPKKIISFIQLFWNVRSNSFVIKHFFSFCGEGKKNHSAVLGVKNRKKKMLNFMTSGPMKGCFSTFCYKLNFIKSYMKPTRLNIMNKIFLGF